MGAPLWKDSLEVKKNGNHYVALDTTETLNETKYKTLITHYILTKMMMFSFGIHNQKGIYNVFIHYDEPVVVWLPLSGIWDLRPIMNAPQYDAV